MSKTTLKQWWKYNKTTVPLLVIWAGATVMSIATAKQFTIWYVLLYLAEGLAAGFCIGAMTIGWKWWRTTRAMLDVQDAQRECYVEVPCEQKFSATVKRFALASYAGIQEAHPDWKYWDQLTDRQRWLFTAHTYAGSRMTLNLAKQFNTRQEEDADD